MSLGKIIEKVISKKKRQIPTEDTGDEIILNPCPFCGEKVRAICRGGEFENNTYSTKVTMVWQIECKCGMHSSRFEDIFNRNHGGKFYIWHDGLKELADNWNKRALTAKEAKQSVEQLK